MSNTQFTLGHFFAVKEKLSPGRWSRMESSEELSSLKQKMRKEAKRLKWHVTSSMIRKSMAGLLDVSLLDILLTTWCNCRELARYLDSNRYKPDDIFTVTLSDHRITSEHHPYIEILVNGIPKWRVGFSVEISFVMEGVILKIQNGRIRKVLLADCKGSGAVKIGGYPILEQETCPVPLTGSIDLGEGVSIRGDAQV